MRGVEGEAGVAEEVVVVVEGDGAEGVEAGDGVYAYRPEWRRYSFVSAFLPVTITFSQLVMTT